LATAERVLATSADHLLALAAAAEAADGAGRRDLATRYYRHFLDVFDTQNSARLPEYQEHAGILPQYRAQAEAYLEKNPP
jgi:hypothetical protein